MNKLLYIFAVSLLTACTTTDTPPSINPSTDICQKWQNQKQACEKFNAHAQGFEKDGKVAACMAARGFSKKPQGC